MLEGKITRFVAQARQTRLAEQTDELIEAVTEQVRVWFNEDEEAEAKGK